jgi:hypothetical protein
MVCLKSCTLAESVEFNDGVEIAGGRTAVAFFLPPESHITRTISTDMPISTMDCICRGITPAGFGDLSSILGGTAGGCSWLSLFTSLFLSRFRPNRGLSSTTEEFSERR